MPATSTTKPYNEAYKRSEGGAFGGFITSWLKELKTQVKTTEDEAKYGDSIYGIE